MSKIVKNAMYIYIVEDMHDRYDNFLDFLMNETDQRYIIKYYFYSMIKVEAYRDKALTQLGYYLYQVLDDPMKECMKSYTDDIEDYLCNMGLDTDWENSIENIFNAYQCILIEKEKGTSGDELVDFVTKFTKDIKGLEDWHAMF